jgi:hypothetical protein
VEDIRTKIREFDAPETEEVLDQMERIAQEARLNVKPIPFEEIDAMRARLVQIERRHSGSH